MKTIVSNEKTIAPIKLAANAMASEFSRSSFESRQNHHVGSLSFRRKEDLHTMTQQNVLMPAKNRKPMTFSTTRLGI
jgi:hypothetical protein